MLFRSTPEAILRPDDSSAGKLTEDLSATEAPTTSDHQSRTYAEVVAEEPENSQEPEVGPPAAQHEPPVKAEGASKDVSKVSIYCDSRAIVIRTYNEVYNVKSRHIILRHEYVKKVIKYILFYLNL